MHEPGNSGRRAEHDSDAGGASPRADVDHHRHPKPAEKKNEAVAYGKKLVSDLDVKIKDPEIQLSRDVSVAGAGAKRQVNELRQLKAIRAETAKKLDEMDRASSESSNSAKQAFADSYRDLQKAYDDAIAKVRK